MPHVGDDTDDLPRLPLLVVVDPDPPADRVLAWKIFPRHAGADDGNARAARRVGVHKSASLLDPDAHGAEEAAADRVVAHRGSPRSRLLRLPVDAERVGDDPPGEGHGRGRRGGGHAGERPEPVQRLAEKGRLTRAVRVFRLRQRDVEREQVIRPEPRVDGKQPLKTPEHQPGPDEEDERQGDLPDRQGAAETVAAGPGGAAATAFLEGLVEIRPRRLQGRNHAEEQTGQE